MLDSVKIKKINTHQHQHKQSRKSFSSKQHQHEIYLSDSIPQSNQATNPQNHKNSCIEHKSYKIKAKFTPKTKMKLILLSIKLQNKRRYDYLLNQCRNLNHALITFRIRITNGAKLRLSLESNLCFQNCKGQRLNLMKI